MKIALLQHACPPTQDPWSVTADMIRDAAGRGAELVVTQELFAGPYFPVVEDPASFALAEPIPGPTTRALSGLARELGVEISASLFERRAEGVYHNTSVLIDAAGELAGRYRKMHIPDDPGFYEKYYFTPGDLGFTTFVTRGGVAGPLICWDQWFPEAARLTAMRGAQVLLYPTAIGWLADESADEHRQQRDAWITVQRSHAITNGVYVAAVNRVGVEGRTTFWGSSFVCDPAGQVIAEAPVDEPCVLMADCDLDRISPQRQAWPFLRDRRIDAYDGLTRRLLDGDA